MRHYASSSSTLNESTNFKKGQQKKRIAEEAPSPVSHNTDCFTQSRRLETKEILKKRLTSEKSSSSSLQTCNSSSTVQNPSSPSEKQSSTFPIPSDILEDEKKILKEALARRSMFRSGSSTNSALTVNTPPSQSVNFISQDCQISSLDMNLKGIFGTSLHEIILNYEIETMLGDHLSHQEKLKKSVMNDPQINLHGNLNNPNSTFPTTGPFSLESGKFPPLKIQTEPNHSIDMNIDDSCSSKVDSNTDLQRLEDVFLRFSDDMLSTPEFQNISVESNSNDLPTPNSTTTLFAHSTECMNETVEIISSAHQNQFRENSFPAQLSDLQLLQKTFIFSDHFIMKPPCSPIQAKVFPPPLSVKLNTSPSNEYNHHKQSPPSIQHGDSPSASVSSPSSIGGSCSIDPKTRNKIAARKNRQSARMRVCALQETVMRLTKTNRDMAVRVVQFEEAVRMYEKRIEGLERELKESKKE
jgi:hypothetical protein